MSATLRCRIPVPVERIVSRAAWCWRLVRLTLLGVVLALSFLAYFSSDMLLQWETFAALCGF